jgi:septum formation protein
MSKIVLASSSPRRREILGWYLEDFSVVDVGVDEKIIAESCIGMASAERVSAIARAKVNSTGCTNPDELVIAADTVVVLDDEILGKPSDAEDAAMMLGRLSSRTHTVITAIVVRNIDHQQGISVESKVIFKHLDNETIRSYIASGEPLDKAGAYGIQGAGKELVSAYHGCFLNIVGLPLCALHAALSGLKVPVESKSLPRCCLDHIGTTCEVWREWAVKS